ncbi:hypothetical protein ACJMK2_028583, partial [Sinanodonta woodiana]
LASDLAGVVVVLDLVDVNGSRGRFSRCRCDGSRGRFSRCNGSRGRFSRCHERFHLSQQW